MKLRLFLLMGCLAAATAVAGTDTGNGDRSILQVIVTSQDTDPQIPWQKRPSGLRLGYGVLIDASHLLTTEDLIRNSTLLELRRPKTGEKFRATVEEADYQCNLAILKISVPQLAAGLQVAAIATNVPRDSQVEIVQYDETGEVQREKARVLRVSVSMLPQAPNSSLTFSLLTDMDVNGAGAPVFSGGALAGLIVHYDRGARTATMLPYPVLQRFMTDVAKPPYKGLPSAGFLWAALVDPAKRAYLGAAPDSQGVLVLGVLAGSGAAASLRAGDVILQWDGASVDNLGFYDDPEFGRLLLPYLISGRRSPGEIVPVTILRDRQNMTVKLALMRRMDSESLIPENTAAEPAEYIADAGLVIREATGDYLRAYGSKWEFAVGPRLAHLYLTQRQKPPAPGDKVVILSQVLPDPINVGCHFFRNEIVTQVNGDPVRNMRDVFRLLDRDGSLKRVTVQGMQLDIVLDQDELAEANKRIAETYHIPRLRYRKTPREAASASLTVSR